MTSLLQQQFELNKMLIEKIDSGKKSSSSTDPLGPLVTGSVDLDDMGSKLLGARGVASRQLVLDQMLTNHAGVASSVRSLAISLIRTRIVNLPYRMANPLSDGQPLPYREDRDGSVGLLR